MRGVSEADSTVALSDESDGPNTHHQFMEPNGEDTSESP